MEELSTLGKFLIVAGALVLGIMSGIALGVFGT